MAGRKEEEEMTEVIESSGFTRFLGGRRHFTGGRGAKKTEGGFFADTFELGKVRCFTSTVRCRGKAEEEEEEIDFCFLAPCMRFRLPVVVGVRGKEVVSTSSPVKEEEVVSIAIQSPIHSSSILVCFC